MKTLETARLLLRPLSAEDAAFMLQLMNDPAYIRFIGDRKIHTLEAAQTHIMNGPVRSYAVHGFGLQLVELKETGEPIGICGLIKRDTLEDVDIGYAFLPGFWSKGYAFEAAAAVKQFARDGIGLKRIVAITDPENAGSIRVLEKLGMTFERMVRLADDDIELKLFRVDL